MCIFYIFVEYFTIYSNTPELRESDVIKAKKALIAFII